MRVWAILGARHGDNNQVLALAEALGVPFEIKQLTYNCLRHLGPRILGASFASLTGAARANVSGPPPDVTISTGHRSVAVVQALRRRSNETTRSVHVGYPRVSPGRFDLVVATPEYPIRDHPNLLRIPFALTRKSHLDGKIASLKAAFPSPRRLLILGGPTLYWSLDLSAVRHTVERLLETARCDGGSILIAASPRTPERLISEVTAMLTDIEVPAIFVPVAGTPSYGSLLELADAIAVTADSIAMISDAIATGKPVGVVPIEPTLVGRLAIALNDRLRPGRRIAPRDLRFFWRALAAEGLVGTVDKPASADAPDVNRLVAERATAVLNRRNS